MAVLNDPIRVGFGVEGGKVINTTLTSLRYKMSDGRDFDIKAGLKTNGGSLNRYLWWFANPFGVAFPAFVLHDYLVREGEDGINSEYFSRYGNLDRVRWSVATEYFKEALEDIAQIPKWKKKIMVKAVNLNGWINHRSNY